MWQIVPGCRRPLVPALCFAVFLAFLQAGCGSSQPAAKTGAAAPGSTPAAGSQGSKASTASGASNASAQGKDSSQEVTPVPLADVNRGVVGPEGVIPLAPPDGKWLTDEYGRKYFVHRIKRVP